MVTNLLLLTILLTPIQKDSLKTLKYKQFHEDRFLVKMMIKLYQNTISKQQGDVCVFEPTCSHFAEQSVEKYGIKGIFMAIDRLERCNPTAWRYANKYYPVVLTKKRGYKLKDLPKWHK